MTEWMVIAGFLILALVAVFYYFPDALRTFFEGIVRLMCLPVP